MEEAVNTSLPNEETLARVKTLMTELQTLKLKEIALDEESESMAEKMKPLREEIQSILEKNEMQTIKFPSIGRFTISSGLSVKFPADLADRKAIHEWAMAKGDDFLLSYFCIDSKKFNTLYNLTLEAGELIPSAGIPREYKQAKFYPEK